MTSFKKTKFSVFVTLALVMIFVTACSSTNNNSAATETAANPSVSSDPTATSAAEDNDPFGKYETPIDITTTFQTQSDIKYENGDSMENNAWTRAYKDELGINVKYAWSTPQDQYKTKLNVSIASNDLPDFFQVDGQQLVSLTEAGLITPMDEYLDKWGSEATKRILTQDEMGMKSATVNGKLMGLPLTGNSIQNVQLLWIRKDWLTKLGLPEPKTMDDVYAISDAFTNRDPDGNNKNDTFGLGASKVLWYPYVGLEGFFNGFGAYPNSWVKDSSGKLVYGGIQPEVKEALKKLQEMYKSGQIDKEFGVKDSNKEGELLISGKLGMFYGLWWSGYVMGTSHDNDPNVDWVSYPIPTHDDKPALVQAKNATTTYFVVNKKYKHPEAVVKLLNFWWTKSNYDGDISKEEMEKYQSTATNTTIWKNAAIFAYPANYLFDQVNQLQEAMAANDPSSLNNEFKIVYENINKFVKDKDNTQYPGYISTFYGYKSLLDIFNNKLYQFDEYYAAPTETMTAKGSTLDKMQLESFMNIILGDSIDKFDKFVEDWQTLGGNDITSEVNSWHTNMASSN